MTINVFLKRWALIGLMMFGSATVGAAISAGVSLYYWPSAPALQSQSQLPAAWNAPAQPGLTRACNVYTDDTHSAARYGTSVLYATQMWNDLATQSRAGSLAARRCAAETFGLPAPHPAPQQTRLVPAAHSVR